MARSIGGNATGANARTAAAAALLVAGVSVAQASLQTVGDVLGLLAYAGSPVAVGYPPGSDAVASFASTTAAYGLTVAPVALGVFLAFWLLVPLTAALRIGRVVLRSLAASGIASAIALAITAVVTVVGAATAAGPLFGNAFPSADGALLSQSLLMALQSALYSFVAVAPVVMLAGVIVWLWVSRVSPVPSEA